jgi:hypothetical protein
MFLWLLLQGSLVQGDFLPTKELLVMRFSNFFMQWIGYDKCMPKTIQLFLQEWNHLLHEKFQHKVMYMLCCDILWSIWITRNNLVFDLTFYC